LGASSACTDENSPAGEVPPETADASVEPERETQPTKGPRVDRVESFPDSGSSCTMVVISGRSLKGVDAVEVSRGSSRFRVPRVGFSDHTNKELRFAIGYPVKAGWVVELASKHGKTPPIPFGAGRGSLPAGVKPPRVDGVGPIPIAALGERQWVTVTGRNFTGNAKITLWDPAGTEYRIPPDRTEWKSESSIAVFANVGADGGTWRVSVEIDGVGSDERPFEVVAPADVP
jgi:hypothetical protein